MVGVVIQLCDEYFCERCTVDPTVSRGVVVFFTSQVIYMNCSFVAFFYVTFLLLRAAVVTFCNRL